MLTLLFAALPLGTSALEIATGLALAAAVWRARRQRVDLSDLLIPVLLIALSLQIAGPGVAALGKVWPLALVAAVPVLAQPERRERAIQVGLISAALVGVGSVLTATSWPARGPFSHHLTLGYALIPPLAIAVHRRSWLSLGIGAGVLASASSGPALSAAVVVATLWWSPGAALVGGLAVSLALISVMVHQPALSERAVLWSAGALVATESTIGVGPEAVRSVSAIAQDRLSPGFHFPLHAHDAALQAAAMAGMGVWIGGAWLLWRLWQRSSTAGRAALAGVLVGGMTQDTLGDLEVIRALCAWMLIVPQPDSGSVVRRSSDTGTQETQRSPT